MDRGVLGQIQKELRLFEDTQLFALIQLTVAEMASRGLCEAPKGLRTAPDCSNRREEPAED